MPLEHVLFKVSALALGYNKFKLSESNRRRQTDVVGADDQNLIILKMPLKWRSPEWRQITENWFKFKQKEKTLSATREVRELEDVRDGESRDIREKERERLTVDALEENVEDAVAWDRQLVLVQEIVLDALLVVLVRVEVVLLKVVQKSAGDGPNSLDVHLRGRKLLLAVLDRVLQVLQREDQLQQRVGVELEAGGVLGALWHIVRFVEDDDRIFVVQGVIWPH